MTLSPATALAAGVLAVVASIMNGPRAGIADREGAPFVLQGGVVASKDGPLVATAYACARVYQGTKLVLDGNIAGFVGPIYVPRGYTIVNCSSLGGSPVSAISGHEGA
jgi:hypothetical protein